MKQWIRAVGANRSAPRNLSYDEAVAAAHAIARGESTEAQTAAFLMAVKMRGETEEETMAFVDVYRKYSLPYASFSDSLNCAGAYGDRRMFPVTIPVSLMMASVGFSQVLHGSDASSGSNGASVGDLLEGLGINTNLAARDWETVFTAAKIGYIRTDRMCPPLAGIRKLRDELGLETFINTVERVLNPVQSHQMIIGVHPKDKEAMGNLVKVLPKAGLEKAMIVQGMEGSEDLSITKASTVRIVTPYDDETAILEPATFGFRGQPLEAITADRQLELLNRIIQGDDSADISSERDHVIFNAGLRLYWHERVSSYEDGFLLARQLYSRKEAWKLLKKWRELAVLQGQENRIGDNEAAGA
ncbi:MAG: anthranilate phosphoribosyltransferase [Paenibacillaceae bacterium]|nr:anthranilate phosphoribosyltransferase [Paenibacillaceae bacterium]